VGHSDPLAASLTALGRFFVGDTRLDQTVQRVVELAVDAVPNADMTGVTMMIEGSVRTAFFTDAEIIEIDQAQYAEDDGPCLHAFRHVETVGIGVLVDDTRWPVFRDRALRHGVRSTLSMPMAATDRDPVGALNFYSRRDHGFDAGDESTARAFAEHGAVVLANAAAYWDAHDLHLRVKEAQEARAVIEQAKGMLMASSDIDAATAFQWMVAASQRENRKLRDIAATIVDRRGRSTASG